MTRTFSRLRRFPLIGMFCAALSLAALMPSARAATPLVTLHTFNDKTVGNNPGDTAKLLLVGGNYYGVTQGGGSNGYGTVYQLTPAGVMTILHEFTYYQDGAYPHGTLALGSDGKLYGETQQGTASGRGDVFKINTDGTGFAVVYAFTGSATDGGDPIGGLTLSGTTVYGTTQQAGAVGYGTVFKVSTTGTGFKDLHDFDPNTEGYNPSYSLVLSGTTLYGPLNNGGTTGYGSVFSVSTTGTGFKVLHAFAASTDGAYPQGIILGADGKIYGVGSQSGPSNYGTVYKMTTTGTGFTVIKNFDYTNTGGYLGGTLSQDSSGTLYGVATQGGTVSAQTAQGTVYKLHTDGTAFSVLHFFAPDGHEGTGSGPGVTLNGTTLIGARTTGGSIPDGINRNVGTIFSLATGGTGFKVLYDFDTGFVDGFNTYSGLVYNASDGDYYGVTRYGGQYNDGTIFKMTPAGVVTILHNFHSGASDGNQPFSTLTQDSSGNFYGSTYYGGTYDSGTVFELKANGAFTIIYVFGQAAGANIPSSLIVGTDGLLYGTSYYGGQYNAGTVFKLTLDGTETILHSFKGSPDGANPNAGLVQLADGFYGTTINGGVNNQGTVYKITAGGTLTTLHSFTAASDGANPTSGVIQAGDGKLYGTTSGAGPSNYGTIYSLATTGGSSYHIVHQFSPTTDGGNPYAGVVQGTNGALYGTTTNSGPNGGGTAYKVATNGGSFTVLAAFGNNGTEGFSPYSNLLEGPDGNFYGTTYSGGVVPSTEPNLSVGGTVYKLVTLLPLITSFTPSHGPVGTTVTITGLNFTGTTLVKFGTVSATFTVVSDTKITTKVPPGATSGKITVTTPKGTDTSANTFSVP